MNNFDLKDFQLFAKSNGISSTTMEKFMKTFPQAHITPTITEERNLNVAIMDVFSRLMKDRIVFLGTGIDDYVANVISAQLLYLESTSDDDIMMYINSPGGSVYSGCSILDVMDIIKCDVSTVCTGLAASMASLVLSNGEKGKRYALKRSTVMLHEPSSEMGYSNYSTTEVHTNEMKRVHNMLVDTLVQNTGQSKRKINKDLKTDYWLSADEAVKYGLVDEIYK